MSKIKGVTQMDLNGKKVLCTNGLRFCHLLKTLTKIFRYSQQSQALHTKKMCSMLKFSRSTYYAVKNRKISKKLSNIRSLAIK